MGQGTRSACSIKCGLIELTAFNCRFILSNTEQLHEKIYEMSNRIRQLEDTLAILQSNVSDQRYPLLTEELSKVKFGSESINAKQPNTSHKQVHRCTGHFDSRKLWRDLILSLLTGYDIVWCVQNINEERGHMTGESRWW